MSAVAPPPIEDAKAAVERLIASGLFDRSPSLGQMLNYICRKFFEGKADEIKEYNIAVEAFGRPPEFDKKRDSIVRVEAHRLRKRLQQYYTTTGADDPIEIAVPEGSYVPEFRRRIQAPVPVVAIAPISAELPVPPPPPVRRRSIAGVAVVLLLALGAVAIFAWRNQERLAPAAAVQSVPPVASAPAPVAVPVGDEIRILAGRGTGQYTDRYGRSWLGDRYFTGGNASLTRHQIVKGLDPNLFGGMRDGEFRYDIPVKPGVYELHLIFAETEYGEGNALAGQEAYRTFDVRLNGKTVLTAFDVLSDSGGSNNVDEKVFIDVAPAADGQIHLEFKPGNGTRAFVNAIELVPGIPGRMRPVRMVARAQPYRDVAGNLWLPDRYVGSGIVVVRPMTPLRPQDAELYRGERYGNFMYSIPVAAGRTYGVTLHMNEFWWGPEQQGLGGEGSRVFRVYCNHKLLLDQFDLFKEAGGAMKPVQKTFRGLKPNALSRLDLHFEPIVNFALVNALEVFDDSAKP